MSRRMNRRKISPVKIRPMTEHHRTNLNADIQRIINHASKLMTTYNQNAIDQVLEADIDNNAKVDRLIQVSKINLPKISMINKSTKLKRKKKKKTNLSKNSKNNSDIESEKMNYDIAKYNSFEEDEESCKSISESNNDISYSKDNKDLELFGKDDKTMSNHESLMDESESENDEKSIKTNENVVSLSIISLNKSTGCSVCSSGENACKSGMEDKKNKENKENTENKENKHNDRDSLYNYEIEIKLSDQKKTDQELKQYIQLIGESSSMEMPMLLKPTDNNENFTIKMKEYLGTIESIKLQFDSEKEDFSCYLDYVCVKDSLSGKDYFFSCSRWFGSKSPEKLNQITLGYTVPFQLEKHESISKSNTENIELETEILSNKSQYPDLSDTEISQAKPFPLESIYLTKDHNDSRPIFTTNSYPIEKSIHKAVETNDLPRIKELCEFHKNIKDAQDENGYSPIHLAITYHRNHSNSTKIIEYLVSIGADIDCKSLEGLTSLHYAILYNDICLVKYLIETCNANTEVEDDIGNNSWRLAIKCGFHGIAEYLKSLTTKSSFVKKNEIIKTEKVAEHIQEENKVESINANKSQRVLHNENLENIKPEDKSPIHTSEKLPLNTSIKNKNRFESENSDNLSKKDIDKENIETEDENREIWNLDEYSEHSQEDNKDKDSLINEESKPIRDVQSESSSESPSEFTSESSSESSNESLSKHIELSKDFEIAKEEQPIDLYSNDIKSNNSNNIKEDFQTTSLSKRSDELEVREEDQFKAENQGIMFHKVIPLTASKNQEMNQSTKDNSSHEIVVHINANNEDVVKKTELKNVNKKVDLDLTETKNNTENAKPIEYENKKIKKRETENKKETNITMDVEKDKENKMERKSETENGIKKKENKVQNDKIKEIKNDMEYEDIKENGKEIEDNKEKENVIENIIIIEKKTDSKNVCDDIMENDNINETKSENKRENDTKLKEMDISKENKIDENKNKKNKIIKKVNENGQILDENDTEDEDTSSIASSGVTSQVSSKDQTLSSMSDNETESESSGRITPKKDKESLNNKKIKKIHNEKIIDQNYSENPNGEETKNNSIKQEISSNNHLINEYYNDDVIKNDVIEETEVNFPDQTSESPNDRSNVQTSSNQQTIESKDDNDKGEKSNINDDINETIISSTNEQREYRGETDSTFDTLTQQTSN